MIDAISAFFTLISVFESFAMSSPSSAGRAPPGRGWAMTGAMTL
jgi:hypothetical protein